MFTVGKVYNRKNDLHQNYGGQIQSGISPSSKYPIVFLFTSPKGKEYGYKDNWVSDRVFKYSGEGQFGDMEFNRGNRAIKNHKEDGRQLHLFKLVASGEYEYMGELEYVKHEIVSGEDADKTKRKMILFTLQKV